MKPFDPNLRLKPVGKVKMLGDSHHQIILMVGGVR